MLDQFCEAIVIALRESQMKYLNKITSGKPADYAAYKYYVGLWEGNKEAEETLRKVYDDFTQPKKILKSRMGD